jgi:hypothetical protein
VLLSGLDSSSRGSPGSAGSSAPDTQFVVAPHPGTAAPAAGAGQQARHAQASRVAARALDSLSGSPAPSPPGRAPPQLHLVPSHGAAAAAAGPARMRQPGPGPGPGPACEAQHAAAAAAGTAEGDPPLVLELGVSLAALERLFTAEGRHDFEQPVWMVVNLQVSSAAAAQLSEGCCQSPDRLVQAPGDPSAAPRLRR